MCTSSNMILIAWISCCVTPTLANLRMSVCPCGHKRSVSVFEHCTWASISASRPFRAESPHAIYTVRCLRIPLRIRTWWNKNSTNRV
ncbi:hypothetical protein C8Q74DRAFT_369949 [Fomes fomentarius]|nr:hypothetical protein C8Q74DRAFT_369949 [Fomes fomentarius]